MLCGVLQGCTSKITRFDIVDYRQPDVANHYFQTFDECYYRYGAGNNLDVVARRIRTNDDGTQTVQVVHLRTFWVAKPGRTRAENTMINATVSYMIVAWPVGASFEGSGFLSFTENRTKNRIKGELELSSLTPQRRLGPADRLFERAELKGRFVAKRDRAKAVAILNEMRRLFGPLPRYTPPANDLDPR